MRGERLPHSHKPAVQRHSEALALTPAGESVIQALCTHPAPAASGGQDTAHERWPRQLPPPQPLPSMAYTPQHPTAVTFRRKVNSRPM